MSQVSNPYAQATADAPSNPYFDAGVAGPLPDLDAAAPTLRDAEQQRLNRKALVFLAGILGLLALLALIVFKNATGSKAPAKPNEESVSVPTLADANVPPLPGPGAADASMAQPIELDAQAAQSAAPPLPPLPPPPEESAAYPASFASAPAARPPSLMERRMGAIAGGAPGDGVPGEAAAFAGMPNPYAQPLAPPGTAPAAPARDDRRARVATAQFLRNPDALMVRGTYLRCVLESHIVTDVPGYTSCILTEPVYSLNGHRLLLERGSKLYGAYEQAPTGDRVAVTWDRITTPTGVDVNMASPGVDALGGAGHPGYRDAHWGSRIGSALLVSLLSDVFKYEAAKHGPRTTTVTQGFVVDSPFESYTASTLNRIANDAAQQAMSRPPTVTLQQGTVVNVYVARDIDFSQVLDR